jgi:hypothetical protein
MGERREVEGTEHGNPWDCCGVQRLRLLPVSLLSASLRRAPRWRKDEVLATDMTACFRLCSLRLNHDTFLHVFTYVQAKH